MTLTRRPDKDPHPAGLVRLFQRRPRQPHRHQGRRAGRRGPTALFLRILSRLRGQHTNGPGVVRGSGRSSSWPGRDSSRRALRRTTSCTAEPRPPAWKNRMRDERLKMPTQNTNGVARCYCGTELGARSARTNDGDNHERRYRHDCS
jgi:hypothetical protein